MDILVLYHLQNSMTRLNNFEKLEASFGSTEISESNIAINSPVVCSKASNTAPALPLLSCSITFIFKLGFPEKFFY